MTQQEKINKQGQQYINGLANTISELWKKACDFDNVPPDSKFVVFSDGNKFAKLHNQATAQLQEARAAYAAGGYVGQQIRRK